MADEKKYVAIEYAGGEAFLLVVDETNGHGEGVLRMMTNVSEIPVDQFGSIAYVHTLSIAATLIAQRARKSPEASFDLHEVELVPSLDTWERLPPDELRSLGVAFNKNYHDGVTRMTDLHVDWHLVRAIPGKRHWRMVTQ